MPQKIFCTIFTSYIFPRICRPEGAFTYYVIILLKSQTNIRGRRPAEFVVTIGHNIIEGTEESIRDRRPPQFVLVGGNNILEVTEMIT